MYRHTEKQLEIVEFSLPFGGKLNPENRWIRLARLIPWEEIETDFASQCFRSKSGRPAYPMRLALGAMIIKEHCGYSDAECAEQIAENPYLQYFCGLKSFSLEPPFDASTLTHFRKRFPADVLARINERIVTAHAMAAKTSTSPEDDDPENPGGPSGGEPPRPKNRGKLLVDATCAPADIRYPTDLSLLNEARETTETLIDTLCEAHRIPKPRTDRKKARKQYLAIAKSKRVSHAKRRKGARHQISHIERNFRNIDAIVDQYGLQRLPWRLYHRMLVVREVVRQQREMFDQRTNRVETRIVSISQPHVRPIVRGKARNKTEFGAKLSASLVGGYAFVDRIHWENASEGGDLLSQIEAYHRRFGCYPESVHADKAYRNRKNLRYCKDHQIRLSGPKLGKPFKDTETNREKILKLKQLTRQDELDRIPIEGKFGEAKRRYGLDRIMAKLAGTSETMIQISFLVMNLRKWLKAIFLRLIATIWGYRGWMPCSLQSGVIPVANPTLQS